MRALLVVVHRYVGLVLSGFLLVAGATGSLLVWNDELEALFSPQLFRVAPPAGVQRADALDPLVLRARVAAAHPEARVTYVRLYAEPGRSVMFRLQTPVNGIRPPNDQVFVNPYTGAILGARRWGDLGQGVKNLMPFVYRLHFSLALGTIGSYAFGVIALLWTIDCFVGAYLTFPLRTRKAPGRPAAVRRPWASRWWPAWTVRWATGGHRLTVDLHRAGGLWPWAMLFVVAWSSVAFNLTEVYKPVMRALVDYQPNYATIPALAHPQTEPGIGWAQGRDIGRRRMAEEAQRHRFVILQEEALVYDPFKALYRYDVLSSRDPRDRGGATSIHFDANTGALRRIWLPTGAAAGDSIRIWLAALHMAATWGWPFRLFMTVLGVVVCVLAVTGVQIYVRKRVAQQKTKRAANSRTRAPGARADRANLPDGA